MSINITKEGTIPHYKGHCAVCGCEFEFDHTDAYSNYEIRIDCPCCSHTLMDSTLEIKRI